MRCGLGASRVVVGARSNQINIQQYKGVPRSSSGAAAGARACMQQVRIIPRRSSRRLGCSSSTHMCCRPPPSPPAAAARAPLDFLLSVACCARAAARCARKEWNPALNFSSFACFFLPSSNRHRYRQGSTSQQSAAAWRSGTARGRRGPRLPPEPAPRPAAGRTGRQGEGGATLRHAHGPRVALLVL